MVDGLLISLLSTPVDTLTYSARTRHLLDRYGIKTVADLASFQESEILKINGVGPKTMAEIKGVTQKHFQQIFGKYPQADINRGIKLVQNTNNYPPHIDGNATKLSIYDPIGLLSISTRAKISLIRGGIKTVKDLIEASEDEISQIRNIGEKIILEIQAIRNEIRSSVYENPDSSREEQFHLPVSVVVKLKKINVNRVKDLTKYTSEDLVLNAELAYEELLQVQYFLTFHGLSLSLRWPTKPIMSERSYLYLIQIGVPLEEISISRLGLPRILHNKLKRLGIETVSSIAGQSKEVLLSAMGFETNELIEILEKNMTVYFEWLPTQRNWQREITNQGVSPLYFLQLAETSLEVVMDNLLSTIPHERYRRVIRLRYGLDGENRRTLQQIGDRLNITRERVRQLEKHSVEKLKDGKSLGIIQALYQSTEDQIRVSGGLMSLAQIGSHIANFMEIGELHLNGAIALLLSLEPDRFVEIQPNNRWGLNDTPIDLVSSVTKAVIKILMKYHAPLSFEDLKNYLHKIQWNKEFQNKEVLATEFLRALLSTDDRFEEVSDDRWALTRWRKSRTDEIVMALRKLGKPSHFTEIAEVSNEMLPLEQQGSPRVYHAQISNKPHLFAWVGSGTFGLVEWGLRRARFYVDIAEELLEQRGKPLTFDEIFPVINYEREASPESIMFMLGTNPRFCSYPGKKYGLAIWLEETDEISKEESHEDPFLEDLKKRLFDG